MGGYGAAADPYGTVVGAAVPHFRGDRDQKRPRATEIARRGCGGGDLQATAEAAEAAAAERGERRGEEHREGG